MGSPFDSMRTLTFNTTKNLFGYVASWEAIDKGASYEGKVHFSNPTTELRMNAVEYNPDDWFMEFEEGDFIGLKERVQKQNNKPEVVEIDSNKYYVTSVVAIHDGKTFKAGLKPINDNLNG